MKHYTVEQNVLQVIALLKEHNIKKVIASPGGTNVTFVGSIQNDPFFEIYSCVDERSAAYLACGLSEESGEPVVISCTGATAARNYPSGLTEAFYRKLPILAITSSQNFGRVGQLFPQFTDRNVIFNDIATMSVHISCPETSEDYWTNNVKINSALLQLKRYGCGPVHINLETRYSRSFNITQLPKERVIRRYNRFNNMPDLHCNKICLFIGSHKKFDKSLEDSIDKFCEKYNGVVICDHTSNFRGKYRHLGGLVCGQNGYYPTKLKSDLLIHIGEISGSYYSFDSNEVWRVSDDGEVRDTFKKLTKVFEMSEIDFFEYYNKFSYDQKQDSYLRDWEEEEQRLNKMLPDLPFSNPWISQQTTKLIPEGATVYLGILNSLRSWNLFDTKNNVYSYSTVGGFGIDGLLSSCVGASFFNKRKLYFCVLGDLSTFYDINILGNRHITNNLRIMVINNGTGFELHNQNCVGSDFGDDADKYFAAGGHFGKKSKMLLKNFSTDLGFEYMSACDKDEFNDKIGYFVSKNEMPKPILFEVFVETQDEDFAFNTTRNLITTATGTAKNIAKKILGESGFETLKNVIKK